MTVLSYVSQGVFVLVVFVLSFVPPTKYGMLTDMVKARASSHDCREYFKKTYNWPVLIISKRLASLWYTALFMSLSLWAREADNFTDFKYDHDDKSDTDDIHVFVLHKYDEHVHMAIIFLPILFAMILHFISFKMTEKSTEGTSTQSLSKMKTSNKKFSDSQSSNSEQGKYEDMSFDMSILKSFALFLLVVGSFLIELTLMGGVNQSHKECKDADGNPGACKDHSSNWMWGGASVLIFGFILVMVHAVYKYSKIHENRTKKNDSSSKYTITMMGQYYIGMSISAVIGLFTLLIVNLILYAYYFQHDTKWVNDRYFLAYINFVVPIYMLYVLYNTWACQSIRARMYNIIVWILLILTIVFFPLMMRKDTVGTIHKHQQAFNQWFYFSSLITLLFLMLGTKMSDNNLIPLVSYKCTNKGTDDDEFGSCLIDKHQHGGRVKSMMVIDN